MTADPTRDTGSEPRTEAGRRLRDLSMGLMVNGQRFDALILAIEAEARADLLTELRAAVEGLPRADGDSHWFEVDKRDVLALLGPPR